MKTLMSLVFVFGFNISLVFGQGFISMDKEWRMDFQNYNWQTEEWVHYYSNYKFLDSLEFNGYKYYELFQASEPDFTFQSCGFYREESKRVYYTFRSDQEEQLLYDFSVEVGDTMFSGERILIIENIDSIQLNDGTYKNRFTTSESVRLEIIEDIGALRSPFDPSQFFISDAGFHLSCYFEEEEMSYANPMIGDSYCMTSSLVAKEKDKAKIFLAHNTLIIEGHLQYPLEISYYNFSGELLTRRIINQNQAKLPESLPFGLNIVRMQDSSENQVSHVFLKG